MTTHILFTCAGRRNYLINYFKEALNGRGKVFAADMSHSAPAMVDADVAIKISSIYSDTYISELKKIITTHKIKALISLNDLELPIIAHHKLELERDTDCKVLISNPTVIELAFDKVKTFNFLNSIGLKTPKTFTTIQQVKNAMAIDGLEFPMVVKPRWGSASIGIDFPETMIELELAFKLQHLKLKKSILKSASETDMEHAILIQEKINGKEYGMDIVNDFEGNYIGTFAREKLNMRSGETDKAVSVINSGFDRIGETISKHLKHIGNLDCDVFEARNSLFTLELNPRFGGGYPFSHEAGVNTSAMYIEWLLGHTDIERFNNYKSGISFSKCDRLLQIITD